MPGAIKGAIVGLVNVLVVAICIGAMNGAAGSQVFVLVTMLAAIPGALAGAVLGHAAAHAKDMPRGLVLATMILVSCAVVAALGGSFQVEELIGVSCIPTAAACSVLERWTRPAPEPLAAARVQSVL